MRLAQTQVWPALRYFEAIAPLTAISISASSKTMNGALPPSSSGATTRHHHGGRGRERAEPHRLHVPNYPRNLKVCYYFEIKQWATGLGGSWYEATRVHYASRWHG